MAKNSNLEMLFVACALSTVAVGKCNDGIRHNSQKRELNKQIETLSKELNEVNLQYKNVVDGLVCSEENSNPANFVCEEENNNN